jgi:hypothetical protein
VGFLLVQPALIFAVLERGFFIEDTIMIDRDELIAKLLHDYRQELECLTDAELLATFRTTSNPEAMSQMAEAMYRGFK